MIEIVFTAFINIVVTYALASIIRSIFHEVGHCIISIVTSIFYKHKLTSSDCKITISINNSSYCDCELYHYLKSKIDSKKFTSKDRTILNINALAGNLVESVLYFIIIYLGYKYDNYCLMIAFSLLLISTTLVMLAFCFAGPDKLGLDDFSIVRNYKSFDPGKVLIDNKSIAQKCNKKKTICKLLSVFLFFVILEYCKYTYIICDVIYNNRLYIIYYYCVVLLLILITHWKVDKNG